MATFKSVIMAGGLAAALAVTLAATQSEARRGGGHGHSGGHVVRSGGVHFSGGGGRSYAARRSRGGYGYRYVYRTGPVLPYYSTYVYDDCSWLRRRALATGSRYWWRRYYACRGY